MSATVQNRMGHAEPTPSPRSARAVSCRVCSASRLTKRQASSSHLKSSRATGICQYPPALPFGLPAVGHLAPLGSSVFCSTMALPRRCWPGAGQRPVLRSLRMPSARHWHWLSLPANAARSLRDRAENKHPRPFAVRIGEHVMQPPAHGPQSAQTLLRLPQLMAAGQILRFKQADQDEIGKLWLLTGRSRRKSAHLPKVKSFCPFVQSRESIHFARSHCANRGICAAG
jgi:hypothetical protein